MKKVGIITFHTALNYGAVLQTYALQNFLNDQGIENEVIDYACPFIEKCYKPFHIENKKILNAIVRGLLFGRTISKKRDRFNSFVSNYINLSEKYLDSKSINKVKDDYSYFISGSDQVWSPITAGFDSVYFLDFADDNQKISYAASIGANEIAEDLKMKYVERLDGFNEISVREESAKELLNDIGIKTKIEVHADPTLLLKKDSWSKLSAELPDSIHSKYLLVFNVEKPINDLEFAKAKAKEFDLQLVYLNDRTVKKDKDITYIQAASPELFLSLFRNAEMIVSNSFHGTVFSIIFKKQFYVELENKKQRNIRVENLLRDLELNNREINEVDSIINDEMWNHVENILEEKRIMAKEYLERNIN